MDDFEEAEDQKALSALRKKINDFKKFMPITEILPEYRFQEKISRIHTRIVK